MSIWQTKPWQDMLIASGQSEEYFVVEQGIMSPDSIESGLDNKIYVEKRKVSLGEDGLFVIGFEGELDEDTQESLEELCREEKCLFLQVETIEYGMQTVVNDISQETTPPPASQVSPSIRGNEKASFGEIVSQGVLFSSPSERGREPVAENRGSFASGHYKKFIPPYTALIDLTQSEDEILAAMKPKGRYNIKLARKKGVVVEQVDPHIGNITKFYKLMNETTARDSFVGNTLEYYKIFLESLNTSQMFFAYHEEEIIAAGIFIVEGGVMTYYYGASSSNKRNLMAPYLLQWSAIEHAMKRGYKIYDFLGVAGDNEKKSSLSGVTDFKMKLSPQKILVSGGSIFVNKRLKYMMIMLMRKIKK